MNQKQILTIAARKASKHPAMKAARDRIVDDIKAFAAESEDDGTFVDSIETFENVGPNGVVDQMIRISDPAAIPKEYGHFAEDGTFVEGMGAVQRALDRARNQ